jgi:hypothetical protein
MLKSEAPIPALSKCQWSVWPIKSHQLIHPVSPQYADDRPFVGAVFGSSQRLFMADCTHPPYSQKAAVRL